MNKAILIGRLGADPEVRATQDGREIANLRVATSERWKDKSTGERKEKTEWHKVSVFSQGLVEVCKKYLNKGDEVYVEGQIQTRKWTNKEGVDQYSTEVVLQGFNATLVMIGGKKEKSGESAPEPSTHAELDDEVPF